MSRRRHEPRVQPVTVAGVALAARVTSVGVDLTVGQSPQVTVAILDVGWQLHASGGLAEDAAVDAAGMPLVVAATELDAHRLTVVCRSRLLRALDERTGPLRVAGVSASRFAEMEAAAVGYPALTQPTAARPEVVRDTDEDGDSSRTTLDRLAQEEGMVSFDAGGLLVFAAPTWLAERGAGDPVHVTWGADGADAPQTAPQCRSSVDDADDAEVTVVLPWARRYDARPGGVLRLSGVPRFDRDYLIHSVRWDELRAPAGATVTGKVPADPQQAAAGDNAAAGGQDAAASGEAQEIPDRYLQLYRAAAGVCEATDWATLAAVGWAESRHGANTGPSSAGARGPMQFMPATWREWGQGGDVDAAADAIPAAARYLCHLHRGARGDLRRTLASYNAGPGNYAAGYGYADKVLAKARAYRA